MPGIKSDFSQGDIERMMDELGKSLRSQFQIMQDAKDGDLMSAFRASAAKDPRGKELHAMLRVAIGVSGAKTPVEEVTLMVSKAEAAGYNAGALKEVLPDVQALAVILRNTRHAPEDRVRTMRDYMNKAHPKV